MKDLQAILRAKYELECAEPDQMAVCKQRYDRLVAEAIQGTSVSPHEFAHLIHDRYIQFRRDIQRKEDTGPPRQLPKS
ncbi:MAG: hypothetical protein ABSH14_09635 [Verrucomicrobiia bacterium]